MVTLEELQIPEVQVEEFVCMKTGLLWHPLMWPLVKRKGLLKDSRKRSHLQAVTNVTGCHLFVPCGRRFFSSLSLAEKLYCTPLRTPDLYGETTVVVAAS
ncbi:hypothetical protein ILYODFUR_033923 [Ilyodon furcidens]|uniref:Uncharacterized protein n=1 Tax=Ilyodon furcidens TaxID=33524 RepID=A0ABV0TDN3_9TELE